MTPAQRSKCMSRIRATNTRPELVLRHALWDRGFRYRVNYDKLPGKPDIVLPKYHTVVFVHGCFWHGHTGCSKFVLPKSNLEYWGTKIQANKNRDQDTWRQLEAKGWSVIIVWECELEKDKLNETIERVLAEISHNGERYNRFLNERREANVAYHMQRMKQKASEEVLMREIKDSVSKTR